jgi:hypothetical protein
MVSITNAPTATASNTAATNASLGAANHARRSGSASLRITRWRSPAGGSVPMISRTAPSIASSNLSPLTLDASNLDLEPNLNL